MAGGIIILLSLALILAGGGFAVLGLTVLIVCAVSLIVGSRK